MYHSGLEFATFNDILYQIVRAYPVERIKDVDAIKQWLNVDIALKKENMMFFCKEIVSIDFEEIIEE
jgi:hypothetical protein